MRLAATASSAKQLTLRAGSTTSARACTPRGPSSFAPYAACNILSTSIAAAAIAGLPGTMRGASAPDLHAHSKPCNLNWRDDQGWGSGIGYVVCGSWGCLGACPWWCVCLTWCKLKLASTMGEGAKWAYADFSFGASGTQICLWQRLAG